jgi:hypothetical protein
VVALSWAGVVSGLALVLLGAVLAADERRFAQPLEPGEVVTLPDRPVLSGPLVVYGTPPSGRVPSVADLGCRVSDGGGPLSPVVAGGQDRVVLSGQGADPLVEVPWRPGYGLVCDGPAAVASAPLHVVAGRSSRDLAGLAVLSVAALAGTAGAAGLVTRWTLRPR